MLAKSRQFSEAVKAEERGDLEEAIRLLRPLAESSFSEAQLKLGEVLYHQTDYAEAAQWLLDAAKQGRWQAGFFLADMYFEGKGVPQRNVSGLLFALLCETYAWRLEQREEIARKKLAELNVSMSDDEILRSIHLLQAWLTKFPLQY
jgi:TPR repeat protein